MLENKALSYVCHQLKQAKTFKSDGQIYLQEDRWTDRQKTYCLCRQHRKLLKYKSLNTYFWKCEFSWDCRKHAVSVFWDVASFDLHWLFFTILALNTCAFNYLYIFYVCQESFSLNASFNFPRSMHFLINLSVSVYSSLVLSLGLHTLIWLDFTTWNSPIPASENIINIQR